MERFPTLKGSWPWPWIGSYCIPSCISYWPLRLPTCQISLKWKNLCGRTDVHLKPTLLGRLRSRPESHDPTEWTKLWLLQHSTVILDPWQCYTVLTMIMKHRANQWWTTTSARIDWQITGMIVSHYNCLVYHLLWCHISQNLLTHTLYTLWNKSTAAGIHICYWSQLMDCHVTRHHIQPSA